MKTSVLIFISLFTAAFGQDFQIPYEGCYQDLLLSDRNEDGNVRQNEYLGFIQEYGKRKCWFQDRLTLIQSSLFNTLACLCVNLEEADESCCIGNGARLPTDGVSNVLTRTEAETQFLVSVCRLTDATIPYQCTPAPSAAATPPPVENTPEAVEDDDFSWWWLLLLLLLLLLLCCCCCVWRRRRAKEEEEEETEEVITTKVIEEPDVEMAPANGDRDLPVMAAAAAAAAPPDDPKSTEDEMDAVPAAPYPVSDEEPEESEEEDEYGEMEEVREEEESDDEDERRRRAGGGNVDDEPDPDGVRRWGGGQFPPEENEQDPHKLRPIPPKDPEDPDEWDQPGRDINFEKPRGPDDEAQQFDPYNPDGGVNIPERPTKDPLDWKKDWERLKKDDPDEADNRKHRIQAGLGEGEVFDRLGEGEEPERESSGPSGDVFDWVVQSALGVLDKNDDDASGGDSEEE